MRKACNIDNKIYINDDLKRETAELFKEVM